MNNGIDYEILKIAIKDTILSLLKSHGGIQSKISPRGEESRNLYLLLSQMDKDKKSELENQLNLISEKISIDFIQFLKKENINGKSLSKNDFKRILLQNMENNGITTGNFDNWAIETSPHAKKIIVSSNSIDLTSENSLIIKLGVKNDENNIYFNPSEKKFKKYFNNIHLDIATIATAIFKIELLMKSKSIKPTDFEFFTLSSQINNGKETLNKISSFLLDYRTEWKISQTPSSHTSPIQCDTSTDAICLFSGGIDSLAGYIVSQQKWENMMGLHINHNSQVKHFVDNVLEKMTNVNIRQVNVQKSGGFLQQTRGLLYMLSGIIYADILNANNLIISECGATMYQPPLTPSDEITKTIHPKLVKLTQKFVNEILGKEIKFIIPFRYLTKSEIIGNLLLTNPDQINALGETFSCRHTTFSLPHGHCGYCYGCLLRRISLEFMDLTENTFLNPLEHEIGEDVTRKKIDKDGKRRKYKLDYLKMENIIQLIDLSIDLFKEKDKWPDHIVGYFNQLDEDPRRIYDLYRRLSKDILYGIWWMNNKGKMKNSIILKKIQDIKELQLFSEEDVIKRKEEILKGKYSPSFT